MTDALGRFDERAERPLDVVVSQSRQQAERTDPSIGRLVGKGACTGIERLDDLRVARSVGQVGGLSQLCTELIVLLGAAVGGVAEPFHEREEPADGRHVLTECDERVDGLRTVERRGESFFLPCAENFNSDTTIRLIDALQTEFGEKICVVLDNASYFTANAVQEFVEDTPIELCYLPRGSPELNPAEECWRQLNQELGNRLFDTLDDLRDAALSVLDRIEVPDVFTYLWP